MNERPLNRAMLRGWGFVVALASVTLPALPLGPLFAQPPLPLAALWAAYGWAAEDKSGWQAPALTPVAGTTLGAIDMGRLSTIPPRVRIVDGKPQPLPKDQYATLPIEQQLDALLYLGPDSRTPIAPSAEPCRRPGFLEERLRRIALTGIPKFEAEAIQKLCGTTPQ